MFPKSLIPKVSFMFTNVLSPLHWNFSLETVPPELRGAHQFLLNNPIALQRTYLKHQDDPSMKTKRADLRNNVKAGERNAFQMLVELFDWLDSLEPQGTTEIVTRSQKREARSAIILAPMDQVVAKMANNQVVARKAPNSAVRCSHGTRIFFFSFSLGTGDEPVDISKTTQTPVAMEGTEVKIARADEGAPEKLQRGVVWGLEGEADFFVSKTKAQVPSSLHSFTPCCSLSCSLSSVSVSSL